MTKLRVSRSFLAKASIFILLILLISFSAYLIYQYVLFKPTNVRVTNITDRSATVSWQTDEKIVGIVKYRGSDGSKGIAYDDRDYQKAELEQSKDLKDGEEVKVSMKNQYYLHHVTLKGLNPEIEYTFKVSNGLISKSDLNFAQDEVESFTTVSEAKFKTTPSLADPQTPNPSYGAIVFEDTQPLEFDAIAYASVVRDGQITNLSSVVNEYGRWYIDLTTARKEDGQIMMFDENTDKQFMMVESVGVRSQIYSIDMKYNAPSPDIILDIVDENQKELLTNLLSEVNAEIPEGFTFKYDQDKCVDLKSDGNCCRTCKEKVYQNASGEWYTEKTTNCSNTNAGGLCTNTPALQEGAEVAGVTPTAEKKRCSGCAGQFEQAGCPDGYVTNRSYDTGKKDTDGNPISCKKQCNDGTWQWTNSCSNNGYPNATPIFTEQNCFYPKCLTYEKSCWENNTSGIYFVCINGALEEKDPSNNNVPMEERVGAEERICIYRRSWGCERVITSQSQCPEEHLEYPLVTDISSGCPTVIRLGAIGGQPVDDSYEICRGELLTKFYDPAIQHCFNGMVYPLCIHDSFSSENPVEFAYSCFDNKTQSLKFECTEYYQEINNQCFWECTGEKTDIDPQANAYCCHGQRFDPQTQCCLASGKVHDLKCKEIQDQSGTTYFYKYKSDNGICGEHVKYNTSGACNSPGTTLPFNLKPSKVSAQEETPKTAQVEYYGDYILIPKETGVYTLQIPREEPIEVTMEAGKEYVFYQDKDGDNEHDEEETINISGEKVTINYIDEKIASKLSLSSGTNLISFNDLPSNIDSCELIKELNISYNKNINPKEFVSQIARYVGTTFEVTSYRPDIDQGINGKCFPVRSGEGYVIRAQDKIDLTYSGYKLANSAPIKISQVGWNLIGVNGSDKTWTAESFLNDINETEQFEVNNISRWLANSSRYDGLQMDKKANEESDIFGFDFPLKNSEGYFIKVNAGTGIYEIK